MKDDTAKKLKNESYLRGLEKEGVKVDALREHLKQKNDTSQGVSK